MPELLRADGDLTPLVDALVGGLPVIIPTDTVYGLACAAHLPTACGTLMALKGRDLSRPVAVLCASVESLFETAVPELLGRVALQARRLLPGPVTLVVPNPSGRFRWVCGDRPDRLGVRVPVLPPGLAAAVERVGVLLATSANLTGQPAPTSLAEVDRTLLARCAVAVDGGRTAGGAPSTVVDLTGAEVVVLREGALPDAVVRERLAGGG
jgi:L-threonylcarbamoyladenylate synthase